MSEIKLKRCPFCGGKAEPYRAMYRRYIIECDDCLASSGWFGSPQEAAAAWNRRADDGREMQKTLEK